MKSFLLSKNEFHFSSGHLRPVGDHRITENFFFRILVNKALLNVKFNTDLEYDIYFTSKLVSINNNLYLVTYFWSSLLYFQYFNVFYIFSLIFEVIIREDMRNCFGLYKSLIFKSFRYAVI